MSKSFAGLALGLMLAAPSLAVPSLGLAAVSGFYDSAAQIDAIMSDVAVADALHQAPVTMLMLADPTESGAQIWEVTSANCSLKVQVDATPPAEGMVGRNSYQVKVIEACT